MNAFDTKEIQELLDFDFKNNSQFNEMDLFKIEILNKTKLMFENFSCLHAITLSKEMSNPLMAKIKQISPLEPWKIKIIRKIKDDDFANYCENFFFDQKDEKIIINQKNENLISFNDLKAQLNLNFNFTFMQRELSNKLSLEHEKVLFSVVDSHGNKDLTVSAQIYSFLGKDFLAKYQYTQLDIQLQDKLPVRNKVKL